MSWFTQLFKTSRRTVLAGVVVFCIVAISLVWLPWKHNDVEYMESEEDFPFDNLHRVIPYRKPFYDFIDPDNSLLMDRFSAHRHELKSAKLFNNKTSTNIHIHNPKKLKTRSSCVQLKTLKGLTPISIYDLKVDPFISSFIKDHYTWEPDLVNNMMDVLMKHPDMHLVDIGCYLGVYTLNAAAIGRKVIAIDALKSNLDHLHSSLVYGKLRKNVTLIWNALSDRRMRVQLKLGKYNLGGTSVNHEVDTRQPAFLSNTLVADAIFLDDLTDLVSSKMHTVFMKMDIEGSEARVLMKSSLFFQSLNVQYVQMEWMLQKNKNGMKTVQFMIRNGFLPYSDVSRKTFLDGNNYYAWPDNIVWIKR